MHAWRLAELGEPETALRWTQLPDPEPGPGQVVVEVRACSLNYADLLRCRGQYQVKPPLPFTPGAEAAGIVTAVGAGVDGHRVGDRVAVIQMIGGLAEQTLADATRVHRLPEGMAFDVAASLYVTYRTSHIALFHRGRLQAGETLLVHAGAGGVGSAAIQLGVAAGARVFATAGGPAKVQICRDLGAELVIDYTVDDFVEPVKEATAGEGADVIYDSVGGDVFDRSRRCVAFEGRILIVGFAGGRIADAPTNHALLKNYSIVGVNLGAYAQRAPALVEAVQADLDRLWAEGKIAPLVSEVLCFDEAPAALARMGERGTVGKVVCARA
jgi:NADPH2:quinone reductase